MGKIRLRRPQIDHNRGQNLHAYTTFNGKNPPRISITSISVSDFLKQNWQWSEPKLISPPNIDDKNACVFPEKIKGKYFIIHRYANDIDTDFVQSLNFDGRTWLEEYKWITPRPGMWDSEKIGVAAPPLKTNNGYLLLYHGVSQTDHHYRVGALLLDPTDPTIITARTNEPLLEPKEPYEKEGQIPNVVFPCGAVEINNTVLIYYGCADSTVSVATIPTLKLINYLKKCRV